MSFDVMSCDVMWCDVWYWSISHITLSSCRWSCTSHTSNSEYIYNIYICCILAWSYNAITGMLDSIVHSSDVVSCHVMEDVMSCHVMWWCDVNVMWWHVMGWHGTWWDMMWSMMLHLTCACVRLGVGSLLSSLFLNWQHQVLPISNALNPYVNPGIGVISVHQVQH